MAPPCSTWSSAPRDFSNSSLLLQRVQLLVGQQQHQGNRRRRGVDHVTLLDVRLPLARLLGGLPLAGAEFRDQRDHTGVDTDHQPIGLLPL
jgi:hypothetical protein